MKNNCQIILPVVALLYLAACSNKSDKGAPCLLTVDINVINVNDSLKQLVPVPEGGSGNYDYLWDDHSLSDTFFVSPNGSALGPGTHIVRVTDNTTFCEVYDTITVYFDTIKGASGDPRFNLQFTNPAQVDLDIYVRTPNNITIYWDNKLADGGTLDVDCYCTNCSNGPNENIYWAPGTAPRGTYSYWVAYYNSCDGSNVSSTYTLRRMRNNNVEEVQTGTLSSGSSPVYTFELQ